ncbi:OmpP1/FadL family transporter [Pelagibacterium lentulum]|uniref:Long-chain fatty acid transporter n=1 Tax=Pelagibacterium lentulum TaxID=2029865 RepID=A0A916RD74_9HYPH|nr:outer membrane protein transport protein [Pelagibacterium lentulum]GGA47870.1 long-chain fatty acid transporter [Pelagibacterium lentulum]
MSFKLHRASAFTALVISALSAGTANAGGLEANGYDWDLLFDPDTYATRAVVSFVHIDQGINFGGSEVANSIDRIYFNVGFKADLMENTSCLASAMNPWGSGTERDVAYAALMGKSATEELRSLDLGLTCAYGIEVGPGIASVIGGVSAQYLKYNADIPTSLTTTAPLSIDGWGVGWRAGVAYEIPEYAMRVSAIYNAAIDYELEGTAFGAPASADATTPQTFEIKGQTGIAPGWLALASVKWVNWSILDSLDVATAGGTLSSNFQYRDGWVVSGGVGHQLTPDLTVLGRVTWDRGTSTPVSGSVLETGSQTDRWGVTLGAAYDAAEGVQFNGGISLSTIGSGSNLDGESWGNGTVMAISGGFKGTF